MRPVASTVESGATPGTDPWIVTGLPARDDPVAMSSAWSRWTYAPLSFVRTTRYMVAVARSMTGVLWMPTLPRMLRFAATRSVIGIAVTEGGRVKSRIHNGVGDGLVGVEGVQLVVHRRDIQHVPDDTVDGHATDIQRLRVDRAVDGIRVQLPEARGVDISGGQDRLRQVRARPLRVVTIREDVDLRVNRHGQRQ